MEHTDNTIQTPNQMREIYFPALSVSAYSGHEDYYSILKNQGLMVNPKIFPSLFRLKNGLPYIGMAVNQHVGGGQVLIRIPERLVLSSVKALQQPKLNEVFKDSFFLNSINDWQDRVITVYCMFLLHKNQQGNPWYQMIKRFPKECDIACFWPQQELDQFKDETIKSAAALDLKGFEEEWQEFQQCQKKYPILQFAEYCKQNYKTIFINLTNRSFGKHINYVSLMPFLELFNHHCSKVFYSVQTKAETYLKDKSKKSDDDDSSSVGSYGSNQYLQEGEFAYDEVNATPFNWEVQQSYQLNKFQRQQVVKLSTKLIDIIQKQLNWQDFTVLFVGHLILKIQIIKKEYLVGRKPFQRAMLELEIVQRSLNSYKNKVIQFYQTTKKRSYMPKPEQKSQGDGNFSYPKYKKEFESVIMKTHKSDSFDCDNQIYFRYGPNSNRSLLLRYGFAIEGNKYEHVWISFNITQCLIDFPDVLDKLMDKKLSLLRKFKIHHHILNLDMIIFFRLNNWMFYNEQAIDEIFNVVSIPKEISILQQIVSILEDNLNIYKGDYDLTDPTLSYHQYFIAVYHLQKYNILKKQIHMINLIIGILTAIQKGQTKQAATQHLTKSQQSILKYYLQNIANE